MAILNNPALLLYLLLAAHFLADWPLRPAGEFSAAVEPEQQAHPREDWWMALGAHAAIHGGFVAVLTGSATLGIMETVMHAALDRTKARGRLDFYVDQCVHVLCKVLWFVLATTGPHLP